MYKRIAWQLNETTVLRKRPSQSITKKLAQGILYLLPRYSAHYPRIIDIVFAKSDIPRPGWRAGVITNTNTAGWLARLASRWRESLRTSPNARGWTRRGEATGKDGRAALRLHYKSWESPKLITASEGCRKDPRNTLKRALTSTLAQRGVLGNEITGGHFRLLCPPSVASDATLLSSAPIVPDDVSTQFFVSFDRLSCLNLCSFFPLTSRNELSLERKRFGRSSSLFVLALSFSGRRNFWERLCFDLVKITGTIGETEEEISIS